mmetsp:Transcript_12471/g.38035  ORF Transcript_12471/g.38035 Transcript_12471/m.38035 type:complete len:176 (+) Transcript_12471:100-627(+)
MTSVRRFTTDDLFRFNMVNLDMFTETFSMYFYFQYMSQWPDLQKVVEAPDGTIMAYIIGKAEGTGEQWHGHVSAVTVAPEFRRLGLARSLMDFLENSSEKIYDCYFVDLFVRVSNNLAIEMYKRLGYIVYRTILGYYGGEENAYDMRKALPRDKDKKSVIPIKKPVPMSHLHITM